MADLERRRIVIFLVATFGFSWGIFAVIWATGGLAGQMIVEGLPLSVPLLLVAMFGPSFGNFVARIATREGWDDLRLGFNGPAKAWAVVWPGIIVAAVVGAAIYFLVFPGEFDPTLSAFEGQLDEATGGQELPLDASVIAIIQVVAAVLFAPFINAIPAFGEEFGWRGYLQWKLRPLGWRPMLLWMGAIWGVWHWPIIAMGYNYGDGYWGFPITGMLAFLVFTTSVGAILAWATEVTGSSIPAAVGHGTVNGIAGVGVLFAATNDHPLLGPATVGLAAGLGFVGLAWLVARREPVVPPENR